MIAILPDIHGRTFWKDIIPKVNEFDKIVFLGDYLDPYPYEFIGIKHSDLQRQAIENFKEILELKKANIDKVELLLGNHDAHSISLSDDTCRMDYTNKEEIFNLYNDNKKFFKVAYKYDNILFTHAGVSKSWLSVHNIPEDVNTIEDYLNNLYESVELEIPETHWMHVSNCHYTPLSDIGRSRGGDAPYGSCIWADLEELEYDSAFNGELIQIFGHTQLNETGSICHIKNIYCCDSRTIFTWDGKNLKKCSEN